MGWSSFVTLFRQSKSICCASPYTTGFVRSLLASSVSVAAIFAITYLNLTPAVAELAEVEPEVLTRSSVICVLVGRRNHLITLREAPNNRARMLALLPQEIQIRILSITENQLWVEVEILIGDRLFSGWVGRSLIRCHNT